MIKVLFFAKLSEELGIRELLVESQFIQDTDQLFEYLIKHNKQWATILHSQIWLKAVNQTMVANNKLLSSGDEVAYFPPVTGG